MRVYFQDDDRDSLLYRRELKKKLRRIMDEEGVNDDDADWLEF